MGTSWERRNRHHDSIQLERRWSYYYAWKAKYLDRFGHWDEVKWNNRLGDEEE